MKSRTGKEGGEKENMSNEYKGGIPDIGSMNFVTQGNTAKSENGFHLDRKILFAAAGIAAVVIIAIVVIVSVSGASRKGKIEDVVTEWYLNGLGDLDLEKYYPDEIADAMEAAFKAGTKDPDAIQADKIEIIGVVKIDTEKYGEQLTETIMAAVEDWGADLRKKDIAISEAYVVSGILESGGKKLQDICYVIRLNGRYGVY